MNSSSASRPPFRWLLLAGLLAVAVASGFEISAFFQAPQSWPRLLSSVGLITVCLYVLILLVGLAVLILSWFSPASLNPLSRWLNGLGILRWFAVAAGLLVIVWFYLYSPWQDVWPGPWARLLFALGFAALLALLAQPDGSAWMDSRGLALAFAIFLYPRIVLELRAWFTLPFVYRGATLLGFVLLLGLSLWQFTPAGRALSEKLAAGRPSLGWVRWLLAAFFIAAPLLYLAIVGAEFYIVNPSIRFSLLLLDVFALAFLLGGASRPIALKAVVVSAFALTLVSFVANGLLLVVDYPFSLSWSEGNRFYDYSLLFGQGLYNHTGAIVNPYGSPGRYALWGVLYLLPGLPIWVHRLWNLALYTLPPLIVGFLLARKLPGPLLRLGVMLFVTLLFTVESPLHPPFLLAAALALLFAYDSSLWRRGIALAAASFYAGSSRWTWIPAAAAWGVLADLILFYPSRPGNWFQRLRPALILAALGLLPGLVSGYSGLPLSSGAREYHQPLLWYRLLPNPTFPLGVLFSAILISAPAVAILVWWVVSRRWKLDWLQQLAIGGALLGFLGAGLVVSMKIGGGADLHNLDMYLMTLALVMVLGLYSMARAGKLDFLAWPLWIQLLLAFMILYPAYRFTPFFAGAARSPRLELAGSGEVAQTISTIQSEAARADRQSEVLFMDQRQLLTFGYIRGVRFVSEYEKKYMMDQAMAGASDYFRAYYDDLARRRFALIVTEILHTRQDRGGDFSEENNVWVRWVSEPTLCFYEPVLVNRDINLELLVPRAQPVGCDAYLHSGE